MSQFIEVISKEALADIDKLVKAIQQGTVNVDKLSKEFKTLKLPSEFLSGLAKYNNETKTLNALEKETIRQEKTLFDTKAKLELVQTKNNKALQQSRRELAEQNRELRRANGVYSAIEKRVASLTKKYNQLAAKEELGANLSKKQRLELQKLESQLGKYQGVLQRVDARIGKYNRNVGNYASGWNGLSNSINQLTREAPAFANSLQTGFMALSNNIPILIDEIDVLRKKNMMLAKEGKATKSVFGQVASAFFSWQTALSVGVTLLTLYGAEIIELAKNFFSLDKAALAMEKNIDIVNKKMSELSGASIAEFKALISIIEDVTKTEQERGDAIKKVKKEYENFNLILDENNRLTKEGREEIDLFILFLCCARQCLVGPHQQKQISLVGFVYDLAFGYHLNY